MSTALASNDANRSHPIADRPRYPRWPLVPEHLASKTTLKREGLAPSGPPVAEVYQRTNHRVIDLHDRREVRPKNAATPAHDITHQPPLL